MAQFNPTKAHNAVISRLCSIQKSLAANPAGSDAILQQILDAITLLVNKPEIESVVPRAICNNGIRVGYIADLYDEESDTILHIYYDSDGVRTNVEPVGEPCVVEDISFKFFEEDKCTPSGKVKQVLCLMFENTTLINTSTFWIVNGVKADVEPVGIGDCVEECFQYIGDFDGDNLPDKPITGFQILKDKCDVHCKILIKTTIGDITMYPGEMILSKPFKCPITIVDIEVLEGGCNKEDIKGRWSYTSTTIDRI